MHGPISSGKVGGEHGRFVYYIGIIDFLIPWNAKKKVDPNDGGPTPVAVKGLGADL